MNINLSQENEEFINKYSEINNLTQEEYTNKLIDEIRYRLQLFDNVIEPSKNYLVINKDNMKLFKRVNSFYNPSAPNEVVKMRQKVIKDLYNNKCVYCKYELTDDNANIDHVIPRSHKELFEKLFPDLNINNLINLVPVCKDCNKTKNDKLMMNELMLYNIYLTTTSKSIKYVAELLNKTLKGNKVSKNSKEVKKKKLQEQKHNWTKLINFFNTMKFDKEYSKKEISEFLNTTGLRHLLEHEEIVKYLEKHKNIVIKNRYIIKLKNE